MLTSVQTYILIDKVLSFFFFQVQLNSIIWLIAQNNHKIELNYMSKELCICNICMFMKEYLLGAWRKLLRVKKPCWWSPPLLSLSSGNSCTLSLQDPDDISLLDADSTSCGSKFSLLLSWVTSMMSSLSLSLSLSNKTLWLFYVELELLLMKSWKHKHGKVFDK